MGTGRCFQYVVPFVNLSLFALSDAFGAEGPLSEAEIMAIIHGPPDDPARDHGLTLYRTTRPTVLVSDDGEDELDKALADQVEDGTQLVLSR